MKKYFLLLFVLFGKYSSSQIIVKKELKLIDSLTNQPVIGGSYFIATKNEKLKTIAIINNSFVLECNEYSKSPHFLTIINMGYDTLIIAIDSAFCYSENPSTFKLKPIPKMLQTVVVTSPLIKQDIDKITYNVAADLESKTLNILELMPKLPFVSLSPEDNPLLKGKSNFIVLLNGKRTSLFSGNNLRDALKALSASTISKIEIITDPPPRYENEGYSGVINIVTPKRPGDGYNGSVNLSAGTFISGANGSLNFRRSKFGAIAELGSNYERTPFNSAFSETLTPSFKIFQKGENKVTNFSRNANSLFSYEIDSLNLVTLDFGISAGTLKNITKDFAETKLNNSTTASSYLFNLNQKEISQEISLNFNYQKNFKKGKDRFLTLSYLLNKNNNNDEISNILLQSQNFNGFNYVQFSGGRQSNNSIQLDYVHPIKKLKIETGAKYIHRNIFNDYVTTNIHPITGATFLDTLNTNNLNYTFSILGVYNSLLLKVKSFSFRTGFRFENTSLSGNFRIGNTKVEQQYNNLLPTLKAQYKSSKDAIYSISYKQQIQRPGIGLLNPLVVKSAPGFNNSGNPSLKPVLLNYLNFEYSKYDKVSTSLVLNYTFSKNTIQNVSVPIGDTLVLTTFQNIGKYERIGFENSTEFPISPKIDFSIDGSLYYVTVKSNGNLSNLSNKGIEGFIYSYLTFKYKKYRFTANLGYYGPTVNIQAKSNSYLYSSLGASMQVFKNKASLSLKVANPFIKYRKAISEIKTSELTQYFEQRNLFRGVYLSFNFRFGKLDEEVRRNKRSLQIDDAAGETGKIK